MYIDSSNFIICSVNLIKYLDNFTLCVVPLSNSLLLETLTYLKNFHGKHYIHKLRT